MRVPRLLGSAHGWKGASRCGGAHTRLEGDDSGRDSKRSPQAGSGSLVRLASPPVHGRHGMHALSIDEGMYARHRTASSATGHPNNVAAIVRRLDAGHHAASRRDCGSDTCLHAQPWLCTSAGLHTRGSFVAASPLCGGPTRTGVGVLFGGECSCQPARPALARSGPT